MEYTITPMTEHTGAEVRGLDLNHGVDAETRATLNRAFADHHVLVVRGQEFTPPQFIAAAQIFGELFQHDKREMHVPGLSADLLCVERADRAGQALYLGRDLSHRSFQSPDPAKGDDAVPGVIAEQWRRYAVRQHAPGL